MRYRITQKLVGLNVQDEKLKCKPYDFEVSDYHTEGWIFRNLKKKVQEENIADVKPNLSKSHWLK